VGGDVGEVRGGEATFAGVCDGLAGVTRIVGGEVKVPHVVDGGTPLFGPEWVGVRSEGGDGVEPGFLDKQDMDFGVLMKHGVNSCVVSVHVH